MNRSLHRALYSCALVLLTLMMTQTAALALPSDTLTLSRGWTFSEHGSSEVHPATVPGVVQQDLIYEINILLDAMLLYAGVKRERLADAAQLYIENIDTVLANSDASGADEVIAVVEFLRSKHAELFENKG